MPIQHSYFLAGITWSKLVRLLRKNGLSFYPSYIIRILFLLQNGIWASLTKRLEKRKYGNILKTHKIPINPVFIIGHWRTGSTFLHQLISIDQNFVVPTVFHASVPDSFLVSRKYYEPIMSKMIGKKRPMDNVKLGFDEPQEDEYALMKLTLDSPLFKLIFPDNPNYFLNGYDDFLPDEDLEVWKTELFNFCKKLDFSTGKQIVFKNPFHSMRIPLLVDMFPDARFIHIYRNPYDVIPSTVNMWNITGRQNILKGKYKEPVISDVITFFGKFINKLQNDLYNLPMKMWCEVKFEDLDQNPQAEIRKIYNHFGWQFSDVFEEKLKSFLVGLKDYKKNSYSITDNDKHQIQQLLEQYSTKYKYD